MSEIESRGLPAVFIASDQFREAARIQGEGLGFHPAAVYVAHPIQGRNDEEVSALADSALEPILAALQA